MENNEYLRFIYSKHSISFGLCKDIIEKFNDEPHRYNEVYKNNNCKNIKNTTNFHITKTNENWHKIFTFLNKELTYCLEEYVAQFRITDTEPNININYNIINSKLYIYNFTIQKYERNTGKCLYHHDFSVDYSKKQMRLLTYIWYLNDVKEGGETVFFGKYSIKPETGKLLIFPASWLYPYCENIPLSSDKYIITGWIYVDDV